MLTDPAAAAWEACGRPDVDAPPPIAGRCGRCGTDGPTVTSSRIISELFTGFDAWPYGSRRLCVPCAWVYTRPPTTQLAMLITAPAAVTEFPDPAGLAPVLAAGPLPHTQAVILPTTKRRHILPTAEWGQLATDGLAIQWDTTAARHLTDLTWLRTDVGASWPQLSRSAPPTLLLKNQPADHWSHILTAWQDLNPWRALPPLWAAARILTTPPQRP